MKNYLKLGFCTIALLAFSTKFIMSQEEVKEEPKEPSEEEPDEIIEEQDESKEETDL